MPPRPVGGYLRRQSDGSTWVPDSVRTMAFDVRASVSDHPSENRQSVTDHVQPLPDTVRLQCVISENPTAPAQGGRLRVQQMLSWLRQTHTSGELVDLYTHKLGVLTDFVIASLPFAIDNVSRIAFDIELRQVRIATVTTIEISTENLAADTSAGAASEQDVGEQATSPTDADQAGSEQETADRSVLLSLVEAL